MATDPSHFLFSSRREKTLEAILTGALLKEFWIRGEHNVDILHSDIDASGFDLVLDAPQGTRHIQLKSKLAGSSWRLGANGSIGDKPDGCIILMEINPETLDFQGFYWMGKPIGAGGIDISEGKPVKHTKANAEGVKSERRNSFKIPKSLCTFAGSVPELVDLLTETS